MTSAQDSCVAFSIASVMSWFDWVTALDSLERNLLAVGVVACL